MTGAAQREEDDAEVLPSFRELVERFGVFGGEESGCSPQVTDDGSVRCLCDQCTKWKVGSDDSGILDDARRSLARALR